MSTLSVSQLQLTKSVQIDRIGQKEDTSNTTKSAIIKGNIDFKDLNAKNNFDTQSYKYRNFLPSFPDLKWKALEPVDANDVAQPLAEASTAGAFSNDDYKNLFAKAREVKHLSHKVGTEIRGLDLNKLTDVEKRELALLVARRVVVFVRGQKNWTAENQIRLGEFWGTLHRHATTALPKAWASPEKVQQIVSKREKKGSNDSDSEGTLGSDSENEESQEQEELSPYLLKNLDKLHVIYADGKAPSRSYTSFKADKLWHSDVTYEVQPPSYTSLKLLKSPTTGGDTLWVSGYDIYDQLSPSLKHYVETHWAIHSAEEQAEDSRVAGRAVRRDPVETIHPLVRVNPVTGWKSVFVNPGFTHSIVGVPKGESDSILQYLFDLVAGSPAATVRYKWESEEEGVNQYGEYIGNDVAIWDNRSSVHSATYTFFPEVRHAIRVTVTGEKPVGVFDRDTVEKEGIIAALTAGGRGQSQQQEIDSLLGVTRNFDGTQRGNYND